MKFFKMINNMKEPAKFVAAYAGTIVGMGYISAKGQEDDVASFQKKYPNAIISTEPRTIAGMAGAWYVTARDEETGKIIARR